MDPLHITEFASPRYFSKLRQLNENAENASASASAGTATATEPLLLPSPQTFTLPLGNPRQHLVDDVPLPLRPGEPKKRSLGQDLTTLRTQRRPNFTGSFGSLRSKVTVSHKIPSLSEHHQDILAEDPTAPLSVTASDLFLSLPTELQAQVIASLPVHDILSLRMVSKSFHTLVTLNESTIARYHASHSIPSFALRLYPIPDPKDLSLHYLCSIWHRLHVASKLTDAISAHAVKEIFSRDTEPKRLEFAPQHDRMRRRLFPLVFTLFHFFETYRKLHVQRLASGDIPLRHLPFTRNPIECEVMAMYDDETLLKTHQVFPLVMSCLSRRFRPPSYAGTIELAFKGYLKDRPADEVYATIVLIGGMRQAQRLWETKGYNARRAAVDVWYGLVTRTPVEAPPKSKMSRFAQLGRRKSNSSGDVPPGGSPVQHDAKTSRLNLGRKKSHTSTDGAAVEPSTPHETMASRISHLGRKKSIPPPEAHPSEPSTNHDTHMCNEWFCVRPFCQAARRRHSTDNLVFYNSLAAGPPMSPLSRDALHLLLPDMQHLSQFWMLTAEALILERNVVEKAAHIKRNSQVLLELIQEGTDMLDDWSQSNRTYPPHRTVHSEGQQALSSGIYASE